jgi:hypothetical protein
MINPTIETDLVGELCEIRESRNECWGLIVRGRIRAVTGSGAMMHLWIEIIPETEYHPLPMSPIQEIYKIGDVIRVAMEGSCSEPRLIRLIKSIG